MDSTVKLKAATSVHRLRGSAASDSTAIQPRHDPCEIDASMLSTRATTQAVAIGLAPIDHVMLFATKVFDLHAHG